MKYELPIAIVLLAAGGLLWGGPGLMQQVQAMMNSTADSAEQFDPSAQPAELDSLRHQSEVVLARLDFSQSKPSLEAVDFLKFLGQTLRNSPPFKIDILIDVVRADSVFQIHGEYLQAGQGSGQSKFDLHLGSNAEPYSICKMCDGRFLYTHLNQAGSQTLEFVDLRRVQETRLSSGLAQPNNPTSWIATGGMASLFENLASAFQFNPPVFVDADGISLCKLEGIWNPNQLAELLHETVDNNFLNPEIQWENVPEQIPHQVEIELMELSGIGWIPRRIVFCRFAETIHSRTTQRMATLRFTEPQTLSIDQKEFLKLETDEIETIDATDLYVSQIRTFGYARNAKNESQTLVR